MSVIVTGSAHHTTIDRCLSALRKQTYSADRFEVVVVQRGAACHAVPAIEQGAPYRLRVLTMGAVEADPPVCRAVALNHGATAATGRICLFLADAGLACPDLVEAHVRSHVEAPGTIAAGRIDWQIPADAAPFARFAGEQMHLSSACRITSGPRGSYCTADYRNLSVRRDDFLAAGGFDTELHGGVGVDLAYRLGRQGHACIIPPGASVRHTAPKRTSSAYAERIQAGTAAWELYRRHAPLLPTLELGAFNDTSARALILRRLLLALHVHPRMLADVPAWAAGTPQGKEWHRFLYSYCYWYGVRLALSDSDTWLRLIRPPAILMYHAVGRPGERPARYLVPRDRFARQMAWLHRRRYPVLSLEALARYRAEHHLPPARAVVLTFDDGYADNRSEAYPILRRYRFPATIFLVTQALGGVNWWDNAGELAGRPLLSWRDAREMQDGGITFGAHTRHHPALTELPEDRVIDEVAGSRADLTQQLGHPVESFAYPNGRHDARVQAIVADAGYSCACCSYAGLNDPAVPQFALRRIEVRGTDSLLGFALTSWLGRARLRARGSTTDNGR